MNKQWRVEFLNETVEAEFSELPEDTMAAILRVADMIREYGLTKVGMPYVRHIQGKIWEIRGRGRSGIARNLYVAVTGQCVVILRTFVKKTEQTPPEEIAIAVKRAKEIE